MKQQLITIARQPQSSLFQLLDYLASNVVILSLGCLFIVLTYPIYQYISQSKQIKILLENINYQNQQLQQQNTIYQKLNHINGENLNRTSLSKINQQLQALFSQNKIRIENIQWSNEQSKVIINANQSAKNIIKLLQQLNHQEDFSFNEIELVKLHRENLIQLNMNLSVKSREE